VSDITNLELEIGEKFPIALKEFLFLAGKDCPTISGNSINEGIETLNYRIRMFEENTEESNISLEGKVFLLTELNQHIFDFVYLHKGDNPIVYEVVFWEDGDFDLKIRGKSITAYIDYEIGLKIKSNE